MGIDRTSHDKTDKETERGRFEINDTNEKFLSE